MELSIDGLNLIVALQKKSEWQMIDVFDQEFLEANIAKVVNEIIS